MNPQELRLRSDFLKSERRTNKQEYTDYVVNRFETNENALEVFELLQVIKEQGESEDILYVVDKCSVLF
jgi:hypothetical protein